jgi:hypothetical protein
MPNTQTFKDAPLEDKNVEGILAALRYLSREAEGAGLPELAKALEEAGSKCSPRVKAVRPDCQA